MMDVARIYKTKNYIPRSGGIEPCQICGLIHRKWQKRCELKSPKICPECGKQFLARKHTRFCGVRCCNRLAKRKQYYRNQTFVPPAVRLAFCATCGNDFYTRTASRLYCSDVCWNEKEKQRWKRYDAQNKEKRSAFHRDYHKRNRAIIVARSRKWRQDNPDKVANQPYVIRARDEAEKRAEQKRQNRDRHADIMEASRQMEAMRWRVYGDGLLKKLTLAPEEKKQRHREQNRIMKRKERAAFKIFRELGFSASKKDRGIIYRAMKAELFKQEAKS